MNWDRAVGILRTPRWMLVVALASVTCALAVPSVAEADVITVTNTNDTGAGSLRDAIASSNGTTTITFDQALAGQTITLTSGALVIPHALTISGLGADSLTISGNFSHEVFDIEASASSDDVTISGLTISDGSFNTAGTSGGGGIFAHTVRQLTLSGDAIVDNEAAVSSPTSGGGGGVYVDGGSLIVSGSTINDNLAGLGGATGSASNGGGGIYSNHGEVTIAGTTINDNSVEQSMTTSSNSDGGGGIYSNSGDVAITASTVDDNTATIDAGNGSDGGGGVYSAGGAVTLSADSIDDNTFELDSSTGGVNGGGGVYSEGGAIDVSLSSISDNTAEVTSSGDENGGGAVYDDGGGGTYANSTLSENSTTVTGSSGTDNGGGAIIAFTRSTASDLTIADNDINEPGGAIQSQGNFELKNTILAANSASPADNCHGAGTFTSAGFNLEDGNSCSLNATGDHVNTNPQLGPVQNNGGPTPTQALLAGSPAVDAGSCTDVNGVTVPIDQRGVARPQPTGGLCDIGAFELVEGSSNPPPPSPPAAPVAPATTPGTLAATGSTGASFSGSVNPEGQVTTVFFQYGIDARYRPGGGTGVTYDQSTPPQTLPADSAAHAVSAAASNLVPNALYHVRLVATNATGTTFGPDQTFTTMTDPAPPPPVLGQKLDVKPVSGQVFVLVGKKLVPLTEASQLRPGAVLDTRHGQLELTVASAAKHKRQSGTFGGAIFRITQAHTALTTLSLVENAFQGAPTYATCRAHATPDASAAASSRRTLQLLHASAHGKFSTRGRYSAATVLGTKWTIADRCDGTLVQDITDTVLVNDLVRHKRILLHAGQSYLARPRAHQ
jgi:hypothetical protein